MAVIKQIRIAMKNRPGALAELCTELAKRAVNISAIQANESAPDTIRLVATPLDVAKKVCEQMQLDFREETAIAAHLADRPGSLGRLTRKLAEKNINIEYVYGSIGKSAERALVIIGVDNVDAAARVLK
ncbi:MAG: ACT domain-containing protein [Acidobacteria bacterium]|nr:ACT domain-containing protein [Acidobacteriota bacterium]MCL5288441.1 ACT domain-containing protein [Acidobacteriota bacterium]